MQVGKAVGSEGLVAGQVVDIKSEGAGQAVGLETLKVGLVCSLQSQAVFTEDCRAPPTAGIGCRMNQSPTAEWAAIGGLV